MTLILYPVEETTAAEDAVVGDLNQDGSLDVTDAVLLGKRCGWCSGTVCGTEIQCRCQP